MRMNKGNERTRQDHRYGMSEEDFNARHADKMAKKKAAREKIMATRDRRRVW